MQTFLSITILIILAAISPGPDFSIVTKNSILYSRRIGIYTAAGVSCSLLVHTTYCIFGLAVLISQSLLVFSIIKYLGAAYLIYLGVMSLREKQQNMILQSHSEIGAISQKKAFLQGLFCNLLNPKAIMFLLAFFTLVVDPAYPLWIVFAYGLEVAAIHMIWFSGLACLLTHASVIAHIGRVQFYIVKIMGVALIAFGVRVAMLPAMGS